MLPFITGSHAYGEPNAESDIDLVIFVDHDLADILKGQAEEICDQQGGHYGFMENSFPLRFGKLNLIVCTCPIAYAIWMKATARLQEESPISREEAISYHKKLRKHFKVNAELPSMEIPF